MLEYSGMNTRTSHPCPCSARGSALATSASPPDLASGATSEAMKQMRRLIGIGGGVGAVWDGVGEEDTDLGPPVCYCCVTVPAEGRHAGGRRRPGPDVAPWVGHDRGYSNHAHLAVQ